MAVSFNVEHTRTAEYRLLPQHITVHPDLNGRHELPNVEPLIADIIQNGQIVPITIRSDGGAPVLVAGFSRWRAISEINKRKLTPVPMQLRCTYIQCNEAEGFIRNISENRVRSDVSPIDDAHNIKRLMNVYSYTEEQVVGVYYPHLNADDEQGQKDAKRWVKQRIALISLTPEAEKAVRSGRVKPSAAVAIAKLSSEQQKELVKGDKAVDSKAVKAAKPKGKDKPTGKTATLEGITSALQDVIDTGKFPGISGKLVEASDDMVEFLSNVLEGKAAKRAATSGD